MSKEYKIFCYKHPRTQQIKYIGSTTRNVVHLYKCYKCSANKGCQRPLCVWLNEIGKPPIIKILETTTDLKRKKYWIDRYSKNRTLLNIDKKSNQSYINAGKAHHKKMNKEQMIDTLIKFYNKTKRFPILAMGATRWSGDPDNKLCEKFKIPCAATFIRVFGSYPEARNIALGKITKDKNSVFVPNVKSGKRTDPNTKIKLLNALIEYKNKKGHYPTESAWRKEGFNTGGLSLNHYYKVFENMTKARELADKFISTLQSSDEQ